MWLTLFPFYNASNLAMKSWTTDIIFSSIYIDDHLIRATGIDYLF